MKSSPRSGRRNGRIKNGRKKSLALDNDGYAILKIMAFFYNVRIWNLSSIPYLRLLTERLSFVDWPLDRAEHVEELIITESIILRID